uniref:Aminotransferase class V domain-containing protein n=1 Tax=Guillardia theta TaxID=55529 RepID=A0A7S4HBE6_GUITH|mmetsp:Transcript_12966/g.45590  ORF Transcript_12966/g.45590 Transcript_12966/m.45590 type:complete len:134 (+) Transcript_12966:702-1103(+)
MWSMCNKRSWREATKLLQQASLAPTSTCPDSQAGGNELEGFYEAAARLLSCGKDEVAFVESATRGWALAFYSLPLEEGDRIITSAADYGSNFVAYLQARDSKGAEVVVVPDDEGGQIDLQRLREEARHPKVAS